MITQKQKDKKRNFKILFERRIILSHQNEKHVDKSMYAFYGICLIIFSVFIILLSTMFFFFNMHPYALYYYIITVGTIPIYILYKYFTWIFLQLFKYS
ncbi:conserved Plasmodium protein, unknown function [Plasmodium reichenowi]|uniref:Uncharacterized protein n=12 Tax=Plasmodium (Laverania) TaxID=418107 RepID=Q8IJH0_PLAF7|nr:conserved Plasmodium protein, unknown function [Plasmodium falciparum 3D7]XP_019970432.1 hypothetical protein PRSY57_1022900 [Plasmodium reichenowi]ETW28587.1 hypothetical protein PFFCH_03958 [Plasmodium falciparum FCH/4]ETW36290.1 hypothetical protein PFTANZ_02994 [Plasmodium falciparum Tanzania (2000708)]ETW42416.1 hypothetical protein PFNF135_03078 [Plasmodium falciparum NF135/5.C10]ETW46185.1 hypothetical protein PFMALIP_05752 [Plasmodium falciparum MaliPS096_E11]ETW56660.1 hypothetica|eukprot:XP_001347512.2 conserved Plasmodium protein, unknown function [Plasmodium falciparum 3D7]